MIVTFKKKAPDGRYKASLEGFEPFKDGVLKGKFMICEGPYKGTRFSDLFNISDYTLKIEALALSMGINSGAVDTELMVGKICEVELKDNPKDSRFKIVKEYISTKQVLEDRELDF